MPDLNDDLRAYGAALATQFERDTMTSISLTPRRPRRLARAALGAAATIVVAAGIAFTVNASSTPSDLDVTSGGSPTSATTNSIEPTTATTAPPDPTCVAPAVAPSAGGELVTTFLHCGPPDPRLPLVAVERASSPGAPPMKTALEEFMAGATVEEAAAGLTSGVPEAALGAPVRTSIDAAGVATIEIDYDFSTIINFSASSATLAFVEPLWATVLQFDTVKAVDLGQFCTATELDCGALTRAQIEQQLEQ